MVSVISKSHRYDSWIRSFTAPALTCGKAINRVLRLGKVSDWTLCMTRKVKNCLRFPSPEYRRSTGYGRHLTTHTVWDTYPHYSISVTPQTTVTRSGLRLIILAVFLNLLRQGCVFLVPCGQYFANRAANSTFHVQFLSQPPKFAKLCQDDQNGWYFSASKHNLNSDKTCGFGWFTTTSILFKRLILISTHISKGSIINLDETSQFLVLNDCCQSACQIALQVNSSPYK